VVQVAVHRAVLHPWSPVAQGVVPRAVVLPGSSLEAEAPPWREEEALVGAEAPRRREEEALVGAEAPP